MLGYTIAAELVDITRFPSPKKLCGYTGLCPLVYQSGHRDRRGPLAKNGPTHLRWALIEAATHAARHPAYRDHYQRTSGGSAGSGVPRSPAWRSPASSPRASGTCSPTSASTTGSGQRGRPAQSPCSWPAGRRSRGVGGLAVVRQAAAHALAAAEHAEQLATARESTGALLNQVGLCLAGRAQLPAARTTLQRALAIFEAAYGSDHPRVAVTLDNLGLVLTELGELPQAQACEQRAQVIRQKLDRSQ